LLGVVRGKAMVEHTLKTTTMTTMTTLRLVQAGSNARTSNAPTSNYTRLSIISEHAQSPTPSNEKRACRFPFLE